VTFLLENHVMQAEDATTPVKQLYFVVQTMLMDPANAGMTAELYKHLSFRVQQEADSETVKSAIDMADKKVSDGRYFDALKHLRSCFSASKQSEPATSPAEEAA